MDGTHGTISGYAARPGDYKFIIEVIDAEKKTDTQKAQLIVNMPAQSSPSSCGASPNANGVDYWASILLLLILLGVRISVVNKARLETNES